jgi:hypothetical protein
VFFCPFTLKFNKNLAMQLYYCAPNPPAHAPFKKPGAQSATDYNLLRFQKLNVQILLYFSNNLRNNFSTVPISTVTSAHLDLYQ